MLSDNEKIRSMADLLRSGATLTDLSCPACSSPLFRLKNGDLWCAQCKKKVIVVKEDEKVKETKNLTSLGAVEITLIGKIKEISEMMKAEGNVIELQKLSTLLNMLFENLKRLKEVESLKS